MLARPVVRILGLLLLLVAFVPAARAQEPIHLYYGNYSRNIINYRVSRWTYTFDARRGDRVTITADVITGNLDPYLYLEDIHGNRLAEDDDGGDMLNARIEYDIHQSGRYVIIATRFGGSEFETYGHFELNLHGEPHGMFGPPPEGHELLAAGISTSNLINAEQPEAWHTFLGWRGDTVDIGVRLRRGDLLSRVTVYPPGTQRAMLDLTAAPNGGLGVENVPLPLTGYYRLRVTGASPGTSGMYELTWWLDEGTPPERRAGSTLISLPVGTTASAVLDAARPELYYTFEGQAGEFVRASMAVTSGDLLPLLILIDDRGDILAFDDTPHAALIGQARLPRAGLYILVASRLGGAGGYVVATQRLGGESVTYPPGEVSATVWWEGAADLDLIARDPAGHESGVFYVRAHDDCAAVLPYPAEHVYWPGEMLSGAYEVIVWNRGGCGADQAAIFDLRVTVGGEEIERVRGELLPGEQYRLVFIR